MWYTPHPPPPPNRQRPRRRRNQSSGSIAYRKEPSSDHRHHPSEFDPRSLSTTTTRAVVWTVGLRRVSIGCCACLLLNVVLGIAVSPVASAQSQYWNPSSVSLSSGRRRKMRGAGGMVRAQAGFVETTRGILPPRRWLGAVRDIGGAPSHNLLSTKPTVGGLSLYTPSFSSSSFTGSYEPTITRKHPRVPRTNPSSITQRSFFGTSRTIPSSSLLLSKASQTEDDIDFYWESFGSKGGQWQVLDWTNLPPLPTSTTSNNNNTSNTNTTSNNTTQTNNDQLYQIATVDQLCSKVPPTQPSPVELCLVRDRMVYLKRDDLLRLPESGVSGNKARKMMSLNQLPLSQFPDVVVSYGGAQSNAMLAIAAIVHAKNAKWCEMQGTCTDDDGDGDGGGATQPSSSSNDNATSKNPTTPNEKHVIEEPTSSATSFYREQVNTHRQKRFVYYVKKLPRYLRKQPCGNFLRALSLGMEVVEVTNEEYAELFGGDSGGSSEPPPKLEPVVPKKSVWIPQGGACGMAVKGIQLLADEIVSFWAIQSKGSALSVCVPGGTCTTAMLLSREINKLIRNRTDDLDVKVVVIPCVGDDQYALRQMRALDRSTGGNGVDDIPEVLVPLKDLDYGPTRKSNNGYFTFGDPALGILEIYEEMRNEHGVYLDLLYGAPAWSLLLQHWKWPFSQRSKAAPIHGRQVMYVHSGGLEGISSQLTRYKHKGLIDESQIQG